MRLRRLVTSRSNEGVASDWRILERSLRSRHPHRAITGAASFNVPGPGDCRFCSLPLLSHRLPHYHSRSIPQQIPQPEKTASCPTSNDSLDVRRAAHRTTTTQQPTAVTTAAGILQMKPEPRALSTTATSPRQRLGHIAHPRRSPELHALCATNRRWCPAIAGPFVATTTAATVPMEGTPSTQPQPQLQDGVEDDNGKTVLTTTTTARWSR
ncbi:hypothetical protein EDB85DRAFT_1978892 [Lactarius pseudohatsudake]|nr:hypothetical protein EDB85DRAFT_1978892 [Lactarius pseudohatsudake]